MKTLVIIIVIAIVLLGAVYFLNWLPRSPAPVSPPPAPAPGTGSPAPAPNPAPVPAPAPATVPAPGTVAFGFAITDISGSGLSRTITAQVANTGTAEAHNVWAEVTVSSGGSSIKVSGQDSLRVDIGTLPAAQTVTKQVTLSFSITDGIKLTQNGATINLTIHSDEYTEAFSYDYKP